MGSVEFWTWANGRAPGARARRAESQGWDGVGFGDSQNLQLDCYSAMAFAASTTTTLKLATAVSNPLTRLPAVNANAVATVHAESGGRATLGIGRGDASLSHIGLAPASVAVFTRYVERVQAYLRGEEVPFDVESDGRSVVAAVETLNTTGSPSASRIRWMDGTVPKVKVDVAASGPRMIRTAAHLAEQITFAVGTNPVRVGWAIETAREVLREEGRPDSDLSFGAYVPVLVHHDPAVARDLVKGMATSVARFSVMHGKVSGPVTDQEQAALEGIHRSYNLNEHFTYGAAHAEHLTGDAVDSWAVAGPPDYCIERIHELVELGLSKIFVMDAGFGIDLDISRASRAMFCDQVMPAVRSLTSAAPEEVAVPR